MANYLIAYFGGDQPSTPEEGKKHFAEYQEWIKSLGDKAVQPMVPLKNSHTVAPNGEVTAGSEVNMSGHTIVSADSIEAAIEAAKSCPFLKINGTLQVSEIVEMSP